MLLTRIPGFLASSSVFKALMNAEQLAFDRLDNRLQEVLKEMYIKTTEIVERYEKDLSITPNPSQTLEERRSVVLAKKKGQRAFTPFYIKEIARSFINGDVDVIGDYANYQFTIKFISTLGTPPNLEAFQKMIEDLKPAHLKALYEFLYITWNEFEAFNKTAQQWDDLNLTWDEIETYDL